MTDVVVARRCVVGEGPLWSVRDGLLYWLDIPEQRLRWLDPATGATEGRSLPDVVGSIGLRATGGLVAATRNGFAALQPATGELSYLHDPEPDRPEHYFNDGKVDPAGRFWAGTLNDGPPTATGTLWRLDADHGCHPMRRGVICPNGLGWSPDARTMYFTDSRRYTIFAFDFDAESGRIGNARVFASVTPPADPDGLCVDSEGCVYSAQWGGAQVVRYDPAGRVVGTIPVPTRLATSVALGGPDLRTLFITTASIGLDAAQLAADPAAGTVLAVTVDTPGVPEPMFAG
ncbi:SMP-30/gluconolactonase/LRE family protein [Dactylosporangium sp. CA-139066]|uniref:SMP-30/gluconolactonase/LRE family protein n=1 Tax=Dactylosporangium sp. CA-139066 TaxID=3239930 RepID=UPI003D93B9FA